MRTGPIILIFLMPFFLTECTNVPPARGWHNGHEYIRGADGVYVQSGRYTSANSRITLPGTDAVELQDSAVNMQNSSACSIFWDASKYCRKYAAPLLDKDDQNEIFDDCLKNKVNSDAIKLCRVK
ncbi:MULTISPECIES: hypothetical protein [Rhizobium/Agrobacterium group]|uniref:DUF4189 domain-containing protein n=1 Tax=Agrobacterium vitis TaxID=373 RepID=A0ABD6HEX1_AGRVI|nr:MULTISPECIES: hypothetical protein [Rhizobium/Agrobacterium group]MCF1448320.1 hypothetical protein [Allorhizobium ampelinum]MCF1492005.1 hypothetical protein [Allorhizobium ampelinum]MUO30329.1 hypothetical protein [Agrobacterium vitis]MUO44631.1 hypothetical protein [Agrobacterium vitis]MUP12220.1 hypothetical protein [Agrobacterium vitis]